MPPNDINKGVSESRSEAEPLEKLIAPQAGPRKYDIIWTHVTVATYFHLAAVYGLYLLSSASWKTILFSCMMYCFTMLGVIAGIHRLWSHRSYKATTLLQIFLMLGFCSSSQFSIFVWARDHRIHHKHSDTDADPHNATRGFFFSHLGWLLVDRHPEFYKRVKLVEKSDLISNPVVMFQKRHQAWLNLAFAVIIPTLIPYFFWQEPFSVAFHLNALRLILTLNASSSGNSLAHMFGNKPYDRTISPTQNIVTNLVSLGEGSHNYHHTFPQDYKGGEFGKYWDPVTSFINLCARLGLAYDLKFASEDVVQRRMVRTGDGTNKPDSLEKVSSMFGEQLEKYQTDVN